MSLDFSVPARQSLSTSFRAADVKALLDGKLRIPPHPEWELPKTINWRADPFKDRNWRLQFHMLRWLDPLRRAAAKGDDRAYAMWIDYVEQWVESNPPDNPMSGWAWKDMADGIRVQQFCLAAPLVRDRSPEKLEWLERAIVTHAEHLADPAHMGIANHSLHQQEALFVAGRTLGDDRLWKLAVERMAALLTAQYDEQGMNAEGAIAYHYNNFIWWERVFKRLDLEKIPRPKNADRLKLAPEGIAHATRPDGQMVSIGDTDGGSPKSMRTPQSDYVTTNGATGTPPDDLVRIYDAGYIFGRSGWGETEGAYNEETYFSISFGSSQRVHGHPDGGSLTFSANTMNWIVDPGKFQYGKSVPRDHFFSRKSHSLVTIEGREPKRDAQVTLVRQELGLRHYDFLFSDDSFQGVSLTRRVVYSITGEYLVVVDHINSDTECTGIQRWQLAPDIGAAVGRNRVDLTSGDQVAALCFSGTTTVIDTVRGQANPFDGWVSTGWKQKEAATTVLAKKSGAKFRFITVLASGKGARPNVTAYRGTQPGEFCLQVDTGRTSEFILIGSSYVSFPTSPPAGNASAPQEFNLPARGTPSRRAGHLNSAIRSEIFELLENARERGFQSTPAGRLSIASELLREGAERGLIADLDLGVAATASDLSPTASDRGDPKLVRPHRVGLVNWSNAPDWRPTFYPMPVVTHPGRFEASFVQSQAAIHTVNAGPLVLPFALNPSVGSTLTVVFQGAINRANIRTPIFQRWRYQVEMNAGPTAVFSDPTLDLSASMGLGWHLGTERTDLAPIIADTISRVAETLGAGNIVLAGSSGGGFTALQVGIHLPDAKVVAISPQVDLRNYSTRLVNAAITPAFGRKKAPTEGYLVKRISVPERLRALKNYPRTTLVSNVGDEHHRTMHENLLREEFQRAGYANRLTTIDVNLGQGHRAPSNDVYGELMSAVYDSL